MLRTYLADALAALATARSYAFASAPDDYLPQHCRTWPVAWLTPPELKEQEGRRHGRVVYTVALTLLDRAARRDAAARNARLAELEEALVEIFTELSQQERVIAVERLAVQPALYARTPHGDLSQRATAEVILYF